MRNYFEIFDLAVQFNLIENTLKQKYYELSRSVHPDINNEQSSDLDAAEINKAYKILSKFESRSQYILELNQIQENKDLKDPAFLMEMMELNEEIEELKEQGNKTKMEEIHQKVDQWMEENQEEQKKLGQAWDLERQEKYLVEINILKLKNKYYLRMKEALA